MHSPGFKFGSIMAMAMALGTLGCGAGEPVEPLRSRASAGFSVLLFSRTEGFRHSAIEDAIPALEGLGRARGWRVDATEDPQMFELATLDNYDVVVFLMTTGDVLNGDQQQAFEDFIALGRGYVGVHSAVDTEYDWAWYGDMLGGYFDGHPAVQDAEIEVVDGAHLSTQHLASPWMRTDEWYNFSPNPSATVDVLLRLDESTYNGGSMGDDHPIAWTHEYGGGRAFYTGGGHTSASFFEPDFLEHLAGGIEWAGGTSDAGTTSSSDGGGDSAASSGSPADTDRADGADGADGATGPQATTGSTPTGPTTAATTQATSSEPGSDSAEATSGTAAESGPASDDNAGGCRIQPSRTPAAWAWWLLPLVVRRRRTSGHARN